MTVGRMVDSVGVGVRAGRKISAGEVQGKIMELLRERGPMTLRELAQVTGESYHALAVIVGRMAREGKLEKLPARLVATEWGRYSPNQMMYLLPEQAKVFGRELPNMRYAR